MASIRRKAGVIRVRFDPEERMILGGFAREVAQLLGGVPAADPDPLAAMVAMNADDSARTTPEDPALLRLLPDAYDDPEAAAEFRRFTDDELRRAKTTALSRLAGDLERAGDDELALDDDAVDSWVQALNDVRLVLGVRLGVDDDAGTWRSGLARHDARMPLVAAYDWLAGVQELLLDALADA